MPEDSLAPKFRFSMDSSGKKFGYSRALWPIFIGAIGLTASSVFVVSLVNAQQFGVGQVVAAAAVSGGRNEFLPTLSSSTKPSGPPPDGMSWIPGGEFSMGATESTETADARPIHRVRIDPFWMDQTDVTNEQFARFVAATNYVTVAERPVSGGPMKEAPAGANVFSPRTDDCCAANFHQWWRFVPGANWRHPSGPESSIVGKEKFPVVQVAYDDAAAYAKWAGKRLPTEAEWEFAARGGLTGKPYSWGAVFRPNGKWMANIFEGHFPDNDNQADGFAGCAPVGQFPANGYGLYDMTGNVWQWCADWYRPDYYERLASLREAALNPAGPADGLDPEEPSVPKHVQRGGSFLCCADYCQRYFVGSRGKADPNSPSNHAGFRLVMSPGPSPR